MARIGTSADVVGRLTPPARSFAAVASPAYERLAGENTPPKVTLITAPTGYGKTVVQTQLFEHWCESGRDCIWISLYEEDRSLARLLAILEIAVRSEEQGGSRSVDELHHGDLPTEERIARIVDTLSRKSAPVLVFIDNLSSCRDSELGALLDALAYRTPENVRFAMSGTTDLPINLARLKLANDVRELDQDALSLGPRQIAEILGEDVCAQLCEGDIERIAELTEGWPAAIRLLQIILSSSESPAEALQEFSGRDKDLASLLHDSVLQTFDPNLRRFAIEISHFPRFCVELCRCATGDELADERIAEMLRLNAFVIPLDRNRTWYRLHSLFRAFLQTQATEALDSGRRREILERAADWAERGGHWADAITYALDAGSDELARDILERVASLFVRDRGDLGQFIEWVETLRARNQEVGWDTEYWYIWALIFYRRYEPAREQAERLSSRIREAASIVPAERIAGIRRRLELIHAVIAGYTDRLGDVYSKGMDWLDGRQESDDPFDAATLECAAAIHATAQSRFVEARQLLQSGWADITQSESEYGIAWVSLLSEMVRIREGEFADAYENTRAALNRAESLLGPGSLMTGMISAVAGACALEIGQRNEAERLIYNGLPMLTVHGMVDIAATGVDGALKLWEGEDGEWLTLGRIKQIVDGYPPRLATMFCCSLVRRYLRLGRVDDALREARKIGLTGAGDAVEHSRAPGADVEATRINLAMTDADLAVATGHFKHAESVIEQETAAAKRAGRWADQVELALAEMAIHLCSHNPDPAARHFTRAITIAAKRSIFRPFQDRAGMIAGLVAETKSQSWGFANDSERRFFQDICRELPVENSALMEQLEEIDAEPTLLETPTARELELISLIEMGLTNQQIADRLSVSVATVKWHLYNLYNKLGVSNRSAALARARALNILAR